MCTFFRSFLSSTISDELHAHHKKQTNKIKFKTWWSKGKLAMNKAKHSGMKSEKKLHIIEAAYKYLDWRIYQNCMRRKIHSHTAHMSICLFHGKQFILCIQICPVVDSGAQKTTNCNEQQNSIFNIAIPELLTNKFRWKWKKKERNNRDDFNNKNIQSTLPYTIRTNVSTYIINAILSCLKWVPLCVYQHPSLTRSRC